MQCSFRRFCQEISSDGQSASQLVRCNLNGCTEQYHVGCAFNFEPLKRFKESVTALNREDGLCYHCIMDAITADKCEFLDRPNFVLDVATVEYCKSDIEQCKTLWLSNNRFMPIANCNADDKERCIFCALTGISVVCNACCFAVSDYCDGRETFEHIAIVVIYEYEKIYVYVNNLIKVFCSGYNDTCPFRSRGTWWWCRPYQAMLLLFCNRGGADNALITLPDEASPKVKKAVELIQKLLNVHNQMVSEMHNVGINVDLSYICPRFLQEKARVIRDKQHPWSVSLVFELFNTAMIAMNRIFEDKRQAAGLHMEIQSVSVVRNRQKLRRSERGRSALFGAEDLAAATRPGDYSLVGSLCEDAAERVILDD